MNIFSIEYPEYFISKLLQEKFTKKGNYSVSIPLSRQQKYYDLLIHSATNNKCLTIQVKSSRTYVNNNDKGKKKQFDYYAWLNKFDVNSFTDFYFIFISYPIFDKNFKPKASFGVKLLVFDKNEMNKIISNIKTMKGTQEKFFGFGFNKDDNRIYGTRGFLHPKLPDYTNNLYENKFCIIEKLI